MALSTSFPLITAARAYAARGWSVIPLHEKRAAVAWKSYQGRHANEAEQHEWFGGAGGMSGIGIVTGRVSSLAVLDLDGDDAISLLTEIAPHLLDTYQVKTRRGIHLYYEVPARLMLTNIQTTGFSLQWEGRYVVAPPSRVGETTYTLSDAHHPRLLKAEDAAIFLRLRFAWAALHPPTQAFCAEMLTSEFCSENAPNQSLCSSPYKPNFNCQETLTIEAAVVNEDKSSIPNDDSNLPHTASIEKQAQTFYLALTEKVGRNHALFRTACWLRDHHVSHPRAADILTTLHIDRKPGSPCTEKPEQRRREAVRTLASAYRRPPGIHDGGGRGLDDRVRQALISIRNGGNAAARALDALMLLNVPLGTVLSREQLHHLVGESVKRDGLDAALRIVLPNGHTPKLSSPRPPTQQC